MWEEIILGAVFTDSDSSLATLSTKNQKIISEDNDSATEKT